MTAAIVDAGPLVALFDRAERHHRWVTERLAELDAALLVCEPVLAEAMYLLGRFSKTQDAILELIGNGASSVAFQLDEHVGPLREMLHKYSDTPMSLADARVVRMAEIHDRHAILTLDSDFLVYRKHGRALLQLIYPAARQGGEQTASAAIPAARGRDSGCLSFTPARCRPPWRSRSRS